MTELLPGPKHNHNINGDYRGLVDEYEVRHSHAAGDVYHMHDHPVPDPLASMSAVRGLVQSIFTELIETVNSTLAVMTAKTPTDNPEAAAYAEGARMVLEAMRTMSVKSLAAADDLR